MNRRTITNSNTNSQNIDVIATKIEYIARDVSEIKEKLDANYVTNDQFEPVKRIVYGMVGTILLAVLGGIIALVIRQ